MYCNIFRYPKDFLIIPATHSATIKPKKEEDNTVKMEMVETTGVVESTIKQSSTDEDVQESPAKKSRLEGGETSDS